MYNKYIKYLESDNLSSSSNKSVVESLVYAQVEGKIGQNKFIFEEINL